MFSKSFWVFGGLYAVVTLAGILFSAIRIAPLFGLFAYALGTLAFFALALCLGKEGKAQRAWSVLAFSIILGILLII